MNSKDTIDRSEYIFDNKALVRLILPLIIEQLLAVLVGIADSIMIVSVGEAAVSGVSLVDQLMVLLVSLFGAMATGGAVVAGQYLGAGNKKEACRSTSQLVWFVGIISIIVTIGIYLCKNILLDRIYGHIAMDVRAYANIYLLIVVSSVPFLGLYSSGAAIFRSMGNSGVSMKISVLMNVINVVGNAICIYGLHMGSEGVAIPTLISRIVAAAIMLKLILNQELILHLEKTFRFRPDWKMVGKILSVGIPNGLENSIFQFGKILVLSLISTYGTSAIAANAVGNTVALFHTTPGLAMALAMTTVISRCVGAGDYDQAKYYNKKLLMITHVCIAFNVFLTAVLMPLILKIFKLSPETEHAFLWILIIHGLSAIVIWPESFTFPATFRASGDARYCMGISIISMFLCRIGFSYVIGTILGFGVLGVWLAMTIDWCFRAFFFFVRYFSKKWQKASLVS